MAGIPWAGRKSSNRKTFSCVPLGQNSKWSAVHVNVKGSLANESPVTAPRVILALCMSWGGLRVVFCSDRRCVVTKSERINSLVALDLHSAEVHRFETDSICPSRLAMWRCRPSGENRGFTQICRAATSILVHGSTRVGLKTATYSEAWWESLPG